MAWVTLDNVNLFVPDHLKNKLAKFNDNGCGSGWNALLVPDHLWFCNIKPACKIHDMMYAFGEEDIEGKQTADRVFLNNMVRIVVAKTSWKRLMRHRLNLARYYYEVVRDYGGPAYWENKND
jgi:hypothetical protein